MKTGSSHLLPAAIMLTASVLSAGGSEYSPTVLETPPFQYTFNGEAYEFLSLELIECRENRVTDYQQWFDFAHYPGVTYHNGGVNDAIRGAIPPPGIEEAITVEGGERFHLSMLIYDDDKMLALYGMPPNRFGVVLYPRFLMIMDGLSFQFEMLLDFLSYSHGTGDITDPDFVFQALQWADVEGGILYVSSTHRTYSESSGGMNAYITAIDLETMEILWRSRPLVSNSQNFLVEGDTIVTGYGFTSEDDYVYLLNRITGEVMRQYDVPSSPDYFYREGDRLYVRCYDCDCQFRIDYGSRS